jgi:hypothetical protein
MNSHVHPRWDPPRLMLERRGSPHTPTRPNSRKHPLSSWGTLPPPANKGGHQESNMEATITIMTCCQKIVRRRQHSKTHDSRYHAQPRGRKLLRGGKLHVAVHQGLERGQQHRTVRVKEGPPPYEVRREPRLQPCPLLHHARMLGRQ